MPLLQKAPTSPEEVEASKPLDIPAERVLEMDENEWRARAFRGDAAQLTPRALLMGTVLGFFLAFTNVYVGLKTSWGLGVAITACILSFTLWTTFTKIGLAKSPMSILETNCMQSTASSAGYATVPAAQAFFPAMLLLTVTEANPTGHRLPIWVMLAWVFGCAALGVIMAIPMKRNLVNRERLRFPSGTAASVMLQGLYAKGADALAKGRALLVTIVLSSLIPLLKDLEWMKGADGRHALLPGQSNLFDFFTMHARQFDTKLHAFVDRTFKPSEWTIKLDHGVALIGAGALIGLRTTLSMMGGAMLLAFSIGPYALAYTWDNPIKHQVVTAATRAGAAWREIGLWYGAPLMVGYGLTAFAMQWRTIGRAFRGMTARGASAGEDDLSRKVEVPLSWFGIGMLLAGAWLVGIAWTCFGIPPHLGALAVVLSFLLCLVGARATGETDITPIGAMGKISQLSYGVLMPQSAVANLSTAAITACSAAASADLLNDLKAGYGLGAHPRRQFVAQFLGIFSGTVATVIGYVLLVPDATAITGTPGHEPQFAAPAGQQWLAVAQVFKEGIGNLHPMAREGILWGLVAGAVFALAEGFFPKFKRWMPSAIGIGLGLILPFFTSFSMFLGALLAWGFHKASPTHSERYGVPIASGMIAGESIMGVAVAALNNFVFQ